MKIAFITGARSDYGPFKSTLQAISEDTVFDLTIVAHTMHFLESFGNSIKEIQADGFGKIVELKTIEPYLDKCLEFTKTVDLIFNHLKESSYHLIIIVGDRLEAYAAALAAHFAKIPIVHSGGGHLTSGAVDNIYRYNITNLATYHFTTSKKALATLQTLPTIEKNKVYFTGSPTVDAIKDFLANPSNIEQYIPELKEKRYILMTFHPVTLIDEPIVDIMKRSVEYLLDNDLNILITYPNNDHANEDILAYINNLKDEKAVYIMPHLGSQGYYSAIFSSEFVIGNSSSGIMEVPYFNKLNINIGTRQDGRAVDNTTINVDANAEKVINTLKPILSSTLDVGKSEELYGNGTAVEKTIKILDNIRLSEL